MPDFSISIEGASAVQFATAPLLAFDLHVRNAPPEQPIHNAVLRCQIQLDVTKRRYSAAEEEKLRDLFGDSSRWGQTLRTMLWTHTSVVVPRFAGETTVTLHVPCTFDFNVAATKYFYGLTDGDVPMSFLFSGSVFYEGDDAVLQVAPVSWNTEAHFRLPVRVWQGLIDHYYPNEAWLPMRRDVFDRLYQYKVEHGIPTWEQALEALLPPVREESRV